MYSQVDIENMTRKKMLNDIEYNKNLKPIKSLKQLIKEYNEFNRTIENKYELLSFIDEYKVYINDSSNEYNTSNPQTTLNYSTINQQSVDIPEIEKPFFPEVESTNIITNIMNMTSFKINVALFILGYMYT
jgi:hypothetical protein